jgi:aminodeoxychorismate synthase component I
LTLDRALQKDEPWARLDDFVTNSAQVFPRFDDQIRADRLSEVLDAVAEADRASTRGMWVVGFVAYEAAAGLNPDLPRSVTAGERDLPLVWFGISRQAPQFGALVRPRSGYSVGDWTFAWEAAEYGAAFDEVKRAIGAGDTYQCNLTTLLTTSFDGCAESFYADLSAAQGAKYSAYVDLGRDVIASASPELFFQWKGQMVHTRPMKGTAPRGTTRAEDAQRVRSLLASEKERAENIIVVDLLRNDLSRIAVPGTVRVPALLTPERFTTVWQLTSEVSAQLLPHAGLVDVLQALFPCGSVTGAPKISTMELIQRVEKRQRGVYCGCIGVLAPIGHTPRAQFSVAIRTARIDRLKGHCEYGVGGGITWQSDRRAEYAELETKCAILPGKPQSTDLLSDGIAPNRSSAR